MGKACCEAKSVELDKLRLRQGNVLKAVLIINALMFLIELGGGLMAKSSALLADSLDMFGDATVYAFSLYVLNKNQLWRARAGLLKGIIMALFGFGILVHLIYRIAVGTTPIAGTMGLIASLALFANLWCLYLLYTHRQDDINMKSTWICSRNDIIANCGVLLATYLVAKTGSAWPDWIAGATISILFLTSSFGVIQESIKEQRLFLKTKKLKEIVG